MTAARVRPQRRDRARVVSPLEQFHPDGYVTGVAVAGNGRIGVTVPQAAAGAERTDLLLIVPTAGQARARRWLDDVLMAEHARLAGDAIVYVVAPRFRRRGIRRALARHGLQQVLAVAHVPDHERPRYLVPIERGAAGRAFVSVVAVWPRRRRVLGALLRVPGGGRLLAALVPSVALVAQGRDARPPFEWLSQLAGADVAAPTIVTSGRDHDRLVLIGSGRDGGDVVAKVRYGGRAELDKEALNLGTLGSTARTGIARVPELRSIRSDTGRTVLVESGVSGTPAAALLAASPSAFPHVVSLLAEWLEGWHRASEIRRLPESGELELYVLSAAEALAGAFPDGPRYLSWLADRCRDVAGISIPFVAAHDDLTMFNVLVDDERLGVVGWEAASEAGLPLTDFFYAAVDAAAATAHYGDRARSFAECFVVDGEFSRLVTSTQLRLVSALEIPPEVAELAFHACWVRHAANEQQRDGTGRDGSFIAIVQQLAALSAVWLPAQK